MPPSLTESLYRISSLAAKIGDSRQAPALVLDEILAATGALSGSISLIDPDSGRLRIEHHRGLPDDCVDAPLNVGSGITGWVALHGKPVLAPDVSKDSRYRQLAENVRGEMAAPMLERGQVVGVISVNTDQTGVFSEKTFHQFVRLTEEAAAVFRQLWLIDRLREKANHLEAVVTVGQKIAARVDQREILENMTRATVALSGCSFCAVHLLDGRGAELIPFATFGGAGAREHPALPIGETSAGVALGRRKQIEVPDILRVEGWIPLLEFAREEGLVSLVCTPIIYENEARGILSVYSEKRRRFSDAERDLFRALAGLGAVAIHNARLYERVFQSEETLRQNEKLTALGLLAAEIAHEVRNPLTVLKLLFQSLDPRFPPDDPRARDVEVIGEKLDQLEETIGRILSFVRPSERPHSRCSLFETVDDTLQLLRLKLAHADITVETDLAPNTPAVSGDKGQLQQILLNLLLNAIQALEGGGRITIRAGAETREERSGAFLAIEDNGPGIPEALQTDVFRLFLTGSPGGIGLGLGIVKRIVDEHRGQIEIAQTGPGGTTMKLWLPANGSG